MSDKKELQVAVFGGGCFWCTEAVFNELNGVIGLMPGYSGGEEVDPSYELVSTGRTKHVEVTRVEFDPDIIGFRDLLTVFFATHDATTVNRQGNDVGPQYRSVIFYSTPEQKQLAQDYISELGPSIVTSIEPLVNFYPAENYHQKYMERNTYQPYCQVIIAPKLVKVQRDFKNLLKTHDTTNTSE